MKFFQKNIGKILFFIFLILFLFFLNVYQNPVKNFFYCVFSPLQKFFWEKGRKISYFFETAQEINNLKSENEELKLKNQSLLADNAMLKELKKENEFLKTALNLGLEKEFQLIFVKVIGKDISQDYLLINKGAKDGLAKNLPVINEQKNLVGIISEVYENFSRVMLISNKGISFDGKILEKEIYGLVKGKNKLEIFVDFLPRDKEVNPGDILVTSALGGIFPPGLLVGEVKEVKKSDLASFQQAEITPFFDIRKTDNLFVIVFP